MDESYSSEYIELDLVENESTLKEFIVRWLERMPFFQEEYWKDYPQASADDPRDKHKFRVDYRRVRKEAFDLEW